MDRVVWKVFMLYFDHVTFAIWLKSSESKLTEEDAIKLGRKVKKGMWGMAYKKLV